MPRSGRRGPLRYGEGTASAAGAIRRTRYSKERLTLSHPRLRVLAIRMEAETIREVARADLVGAPFGLWSMQAVMSQVYDPSAPRARPFAGERLSCALWNPVPPDALVVAIPDTAAAIAAGTTVDLPWIVALRAWARLMPTAPSKLLDVCWRRSIRSCGSGRDHCLEDDVRVTCGVLRALLDRFPAEELVAFSR